MRRKQALFLLIAGILFTASLVYPAGAETFTIGDSIRTTADVNVFSTPGFLGSNPPIMWKGNKGTVIDGSTDAEGNRWWYISYDVGVTGWSAEGIGGVRNLEPVPHPSPPPDDFTTWADTSISWARHRTGRNDWNDLCMKFVVNAFMRKEGEAAGGNADDFARTLDRFNQQPGGWKSAPRGAVIFFEGQDSNAYGHAAIYLGGGQTIDAYGMVAEHAMDAFTGEPNVGRYLGWAYPPESWKPSVQPIRLTLSVHDGSRTGPLLQGVRVTGLDGGGTRFDTTTDATGAVIIAGDPGEWQFAASRGGYETASWSLSVISDSRQDAFLQPLPPLSPGGLLGWGPSAYRQTELPDGIGYLVIALYTGILVVPLFSQGSPPGSERVRHVKQMLETSCQNRGDHCPTVRIMRRTGSQGDPVPPGWECRKVQYMSFISHLLFK